MGKTISLYDFLTKEEIVRATRMNRQSVRDEIIVPHMSRINEKLGQTNDPDYLSFVVEYVMIRTGHWQ